MSWDRDMRPHRAMDRVTAVCLVLIASVGGMVLGGFIGGVVLPPTPCSSTVIKGSFGLPTSPRSPPDVSGIAYDSGNGDIYAVETSYNSIAVVSSVTGLVVGNISLGPSNMLAVPTPLVYDPARGYIFVLAVHGVIVISDSTNRVVKHVSVPGQPTAGVYDASSRNLFVAAGGGVYAVSDADDSIVATPVLVELPASGASEAPGVSAVTVDGSGRLYVIGYVGAPPSNLTVWRGDVPLQFSMTVVSTSDFSVLKSYPLSYGYYGSAYDTHDGALYLALGRLVRATGGASPFIPSSGFLIDQMSTKSGEIIHTIYAFNKSLGAISYDPAGRCLLFASNDSLGVVAFAGGENSNLNLLPFPPHSGTVQQMLFAFNEARGCTYLSDGSGRIWVISG